MQYSRNHFKGLLKLYGINNHLSDDSTNLFKFQTLDIRALCSAIFLYERDPHFLILCNYLSWHGGYLKTRNGCTWKLSPERVVPDIDAQKYDLGDTVQ